MTLGRFGTSIARFAGAALTGAALLASVGCVTFGTAAACSLADPAVHVNGTAHAYTLKLDCETTRIANGRLDVSVGYDPATKQTKETITHPEGKVTSTWMCPDDPWIVANVHCQRLGTLINSEHYYSGLQQAIDNMPQDRPYSAQKLNAADRDRLAALLLDALQPKPAPAAPPALGPITHLGRAVVWPEVREGEEGDSVTAIQYLLRAHGADVTVDGQFGAETAAAVRAFQRAHGITANGAVGSTTWSALVVSLSQGSQGDAVAALQSLLAAHGLDVDVDGDFGAQTAAALRGFQQAHNLSVDGTVSQRTWSLLLDGV